MGRVAVADRRRRADERVDRRLGRHLAGRNGWIVVGPTLGLLVQQATRRRGEVALSVHRRSVRGHGVAGDVELIVDVRLLDVGQDQRGDGVDVVGRGAGAGGVALARGGELTAGRLEVENTQAKLLRVVLALTAPGGLAGSLDGGEEQADERADDRDHDQELDEREPTPGGRRKMTHGGKPQRI